MLRRQVAAAGSAFVAALAVGMAPAAADGGGDDAGWGGGSIWGSVDEDSQGSDSGGSTDDGSDDSTSTDSWIASGGGGGGDTCDTGTGSLTLELAGLQGNCGFAPALDTGDAGYVAPPDAEAEAEKAFDRMPLATADIQIAPGPPLPTYPNLETWVWLPREQWQTLTLSVTAGATTVHVEARPVRMEIDSGERDQMKYSSTTIDPTFVCSGPGRVWHESYGDEAETSCGYTYMTTSSHNPAGGDEYHLTGSIVYEGSWTCVGQCTSEGGSLGQVSGPTGNQDVEVQERQSVVVNGRPSNSSRRLRRSRRVPPATASSGRPRASSAVKSGRGRDGPRRLPLRSDAPGGRTARCFSRCCSSWVVRSAPRSRSPAPGIPRRWSS